MKTKYSIKNFRVFGEDGAKVDLAPLTILTGCNSSGKSSIAKSLLLLNTFMSKVKTASKNKSVFELGEYTLDFSNYPLNLLGRFDKVVNKNSDNKEIEFSYISDNGFAVSLTFTTIKEDILNRGYLKRLSITLGDESVYLSEKGHCILNATPLMERYIEYVRNYLSKENSIFNDVDFSRLSSLEYEANYRVSLEILEWSAANQSFFRIPLLDKIGHLGKDDFVSGFTNIIGENIQSLPAGLKDLIHRISEVFKDTDASTFSEFVRIREKEWMSHLHNTAEADFIEETSEEAVGAMNRRVPKDWSHVWSNPSLTEESWNMLMGKIGENDEEWTRKLNHSVIKFPLLCSSLIYIGTHLGFSDDRFFTIEKVSEFEDFPRSYKHFINHFLWNDFVRYVNEQLKKTLLPAWTDNLEYVGSSRIDVKRLYAMDSKDNFAVLLNRFFNVRRDFVGLVNQNDEKGYEPDAFINKWIQKFNIGESVSLEMDSEGLGVAIKLKKGDETVLLADEGYGITQLFSILLEIETAIQKAFHTFLSPGWDGQNYVYITDMKTGKVLFPEQTIIIEEPEIHLHPKYQSLLADMFAEAKEQYNIHFIIETHSEYLIRRLQVMVADGKINSSDISVCYVEENGKLYDMGMRENGKFSHDFGSGFFDEADNAAIQLFDLNNG